MNSTNLNYYPTQESRSRQHQSRYDEKSQSPRSKRDSGIKRRSRSREDYRPVRKQSNFDRPPEEFRPARSHRDLSPEPAASKDKKQIHFDFKIFIKEKHTSNFTFSTLDRIVKATNCQDIYVDEALIVPDLPGKVMIIKSNNIEAKTDAFCSILRKLEDTDVLIFIPEALVSMVIGRNGRTINMLKKDSGCDVIVNQPVLGLTLRSISLKSDSPRTQAFAAKMIYEILEQQATEEDLRTVAAKPLSKADLKTTAKFVISEDSQGYLIGKHGIFTKKLEEK